MIRSVISMVLVGFALAGSASAQEWARKTFETTTHDFGSVARGAKVEYQFKVTNIYQEDLHIASVRSSCGCTAPTISKDLLKTYEEGAIVAAFNTHSFLGHRSATITVTFDKPFFAEVQLNVSGTIRSDIVLSPGGAEFGTVDFGSAPERRISVEYAGRLDWQILVVKPNSNFVQASVQQTSRNPGQVRYELLVKLKPGAPLGYFKDQITLVTNDSQSSQVPVDVEAKIVSEVTLSPASLFLGVLKPGQKVTKQLVVQGKKPFRITGVKCANGSFEIPNSDAAKTVHVVPVTYTAGDAAGKITQKIQIETDLGPGVIPEVSAYAQVLEAKTADTK